MLIVYHERVIDGVFDGLLLTANRLLVVPLQIDLAILRRIVVIDLVGTKKDRKVLAALLLGALCGAIRLSPLLWGVGEKDGLAVLYSSLDRTICGIFLKTEVGG